MFNEITKTKKGKIALGFITVAIFIVCIIQITQRGYQFGQWLYSVTH
jgi:hypothetical protein